MLLKLEVINNKYKNKKKKTHNKFTWTKLIKLHRCLFCLLSFYTLIASLTPRSPTTTATIFLLFLLDFNIIYRYAQICASIYLHKKSKRIVASFIVLAKPYAFKFINWFFCSFVRSFIEICGWCVNAINKLSQ